MCWKRERFVLNFPTKVAIEKVTKVYRDILETIEETGVRTLMGLAFKTCLNDKPGILHILWQHEKDELSQGRGLLALNGSTKRIKVPKEGVHIHP